jgi:uncharacterized protein (TIGR02246 family)
LCRYHSSFRFLRAGKRRANTAPAAQAAPPRAREGPAPAPEIAVKNLVLAWNRGDSDAVARMFLPNAELIIPTGSVIRSRSEIQKRLHEEHNGRLRESMLSSTVENISLVDANTALVRGKYVLEGMKVMGIRTSPDGSYVLRQKRQQGRWLIERAEVRGKH